MKTFFPLLSTAEAREAAARGAVVLLPIGTVEGNGPHLPLGYDYLVPEALAKAAAARNGDLYLPPITYGISSPILAFAGTIAVKEPFLEKHVESILAALIRSGFERIVLLTNHIPNFHPVSRACIVTRQKTGVAVPSINPSALAGDLRGDLFPEGAGAFGHGGEPGTSLLRHLHPDAVRMDLIDPRPKGKFQGLQTLSPSEVSFGNSRVSVIMEIEEVSANSGWGDATKASAERGRVLFERMVDYVADFTRHFRTLDPRIARPVPTV